MDGRIRFEYACVDANFLKSATKNMRIQKYPDTCGRGLRETVSQPERQRYCRGRQREKEEGGGGDGEGEELTLISNIETFLDNHL